MVALRIARTVTKRKKVVLFSGSYHGSFDGVLAIPGAAGRGAGGIPMSPGTMPGMVGDTIVLPYGSPASLEAICACAAELAAVLVEPVQSRHPDLQPRGFLHELRRITAEAGAALIFDEVISGFRIAPGGAQAHFGIRADLAVYGKIVGGGLPIGIVAGARRFMDSVDGGEWQFGDESYPCVQNTFVAGTFNHHPATLTAAHAVLSHLAREGASLQEGLSRRTAELARTLNEHFERVGAPVRIVYFGSLFRFQLKGTWEVLYYRLMCKGVYVWEGRNCFLSTAHSEDDIRRVIAAIKECVDEMLVHDFAPGISGASQPAAPAAAPEVTLMSSAQRRIYALSQLDGGEQAYHLHGAIELNGALDEVRLEGCFCQLIDRHEGLRTSFEVQQDGQFVQRVHAKIELEIERGEDTRADDLIRNVIRPFTLSSAPLFRIGLFKLGDARRLLVIDAHHIAVDGLSMTVLFQDLIALYRGDKLGPPPRPCREHACWEQEFLRSEAAARQERYWRERLSGELPRLDLSLDFPRPLVRRFDGRTIQLSYPSRRLRKRAQECGAPLYMVLLAAYHVLLQSLSGQRDIIIGTAHGAREHGGFGATVGMFVNSLPLRIAAPAGATFALLLSEVKQRCLEAYDNQSFPFDVLVERLKVERDRSHNPLFDTMFSYEQADGRAMNLPGLEAAEHLIARQTALFDFALDVVEEQGVLNLRFEYSSTLFRQETVERHARHYLSILRSIDDDPSRSLAQISSLPHEDRELIERWARGPSTRPAQGTALEMFEEQARLSPEAPALLAEERRISYRELDERANGIAAFLRERGAARPDAIIGVVTDRNEWTIIAMLGVMKSGAAYLPIDPETPPERIEYVLRDSKVTLALVMARGAAHTALAAVAATAIIEEIAVRAPRVATRVDPRSLAYVLYTSGSTGRPKGVEITHANLANYIGWANSYYFPDSRSGNFGLYTSYSVDMTVTSIFCPLTRGRYIVLFGEQVPLAEALRRGFEPGSLVDAVKLTPSHLSIVRDLGLAESSVRLAIIGGEAFTPEQAAILHRLNPSMRVYNEYGPTETTVGCTVERVEPGAAKVTIGRPIANTTIHVLDADGHLVPPFVAGELCVAGASVGRGYLNDSEKTAAKFIRTPLEAAGAVYRTGDKARWLANGTIEYLGRIDEQVKIRGYRIEVSEIEECLLRHESIRQAAVVVDKTPDGGNELVAYFTAGGALTASEARSWLSRSLPAYMVPARCYRIDAIPLGASGKADKKAFKPPTKSPPVEASTEAAAPRNDVERLVAQLTAELVRVERVAMTDSFFDLGGDSITAIRLAARLQRHELSLAVKDIMRSLSLREVSGYVVRRRSTAVDADVSGETPFAPMQAGFFEHRPTNPDHFNQSVMLFSTAHFVETAVRAVLGALVEHHDALRMAFRSVDGATVQINLPARRGALHDLEVYDLRGRTDAAARMESLVSSLQGSLRLEEGRLLGAALFRAEDGDHLLLTIHHLVIDGVSWRILLEDFAAGYEAVASGRPAELPAKSASFKAWTAHLHELARGGALASEHAHWSRVEAQVAKAGPLPRARTASSNTVGDAVTLDLVLDSGETRDLLTGACKAYRTNVNELLLAALAAAVSGWTGNPTVAVMVEGHGRDELSHELDTSRTVGWFTAMFPVALDASDVSDLSRHIRRTKESLRRVPSGGVVYGVLRYLGSAGADQAPSAAPEITFNYLGNFDADFARSLFTATTAGVGPTTSPAAARAPGLEINVMIAAGRTTISIEYNRHEFEEATICTFAASLRGWVLRIIEHCVARGQAELTPSDLDYRGLRDLQEYDSFLRQNDITPADVEAVRALSPMQAGMLFEALRDVTKMSHCEQIALSIEGDIDASSLSRAAEWLAGRYDSLRTRFFTASQAPVQVVFARPIFPVQVADISGADATAQEQRIAEICRLDCERGFDLKGPLTRLTVVRRGQRTSMLVWTMHHIIIDGWCLGIVVSELLHAYGKFRRGDVPHLAAPPSYGAYIRWLERQDQRASLAYWVEYLSGYERSVVLPRRPGWQDTAAKAERSQASFAVHLGAELTAQLRLHATACRATLSTLLQALWALVLAHYSGASDVVFGLTVSGRPPELPDVERMVGLFINTIPVRVRLNDSATLGQAVEDCQALALASQPHQYCSLADVQNATPLKSKLITHALVFENYPLEWAALEEAQRAAELAISKIDYFAHDTYDFVLTITATETTELLFAYNALAHETQAIHAASSYLKTLCAVAAPSKTIHQIRQDVAAAIRAQSSEKHAATLAALTQRKLGA